MTEGQPTEIVQDTPECSTEFQNLDFGWALTSLKTGQRVTRRGWNGPAQYLELQIPDVNSKMTLPYIYICTVQGDFVAWLVSQTDLLSTDWDIV